VYGLLAWRTKDQFVQWFYDMQIDLEDKWIVVGDFLTFTNLVKIGIEGEGITMI
jgi:hypothetical protein